MKKNRLRELTVSYESLLFRDLRESSEECLHYLKAALDENDDKLFLIALDNIVEARGGYDLVIEKTGMSFEELSEMFNQRKLLTQNDLCKILNAVDVFIEVSECDHEGKVALSSQ